MSTISSGTTLTTALVQIGDTTGDLVIKTGSSNTTAMTISGANQSVVLAVPLPAASGGTGATSFPSPGTAGNVLTSNGTSWTSAAAAGFPAGTVMLFAQTSAPTGWTKNTTTGDNSALRVVTGSVVGGGTVNFTTAFASQTPSGSVSINTSGLSVGATTLTTAQMPSHTHSLPATFTDGGSQARLIEAGGGGGQVANTGSTGSGSSHNHSISGSATGTFTGTAIDLAVKYVDVIRATKD